MLKSAVLAGPRLSTPASWGRVLQAARCAAHSGRAAEPPQGPNGRLRCGRQARLKSPILRPSAPGHHAHAARDGSTYRARRPPPG